jgi:hypothetical protein
MNRMLPTVCALVITVGMNAQGAPLEDQAKFVKAILASTGQFGFACADPGLKAKLEALGVSVGPGFKLAWGASEAEVRALKAQGRFVICPEQAWLQSGACLALVEEGGRPQLYVDPANVKASGMALPEAIARIVKKG